MRQNANSRRSRGRGGRKSGGNSRNQVFDSNGPGARVRGNASQIYEKYQQLARDAASSGDRVAAENLLQHAEHYFRLMALHAPRPDQNRDNQDNDSDDGDGYDSDDQDSRSDSDDDRRPQASSNGGGNHGNGNGRGSGSSDDSSGEDGDSAPAPRRRRRRSTGKDNADGDNSMNAESAEGDAEPLSV